MKLFHFDSFHTDTIATLILEVAVVLSLLRPVLVALYTGTLFQPRDHDDETRALLADHLPEVLSSGCCRSLSSDVLGRARQQTLGMESVPIIRLSGTHVQVACIDVVLSTIRVALIKNHTSSIVIVISHRLGRSQLYLS